MKTILFFLTLTVLASGCSSIEDEYPSYQDIDILMTKSENEIVQYMSEKGWKDFYTEINFVTPKGVKLIYDDKNKNGKVDVESGELTNRSCSDCYREVYKGEYYSFFETSMRKQIKNDTTIVYLKFKLITQEDDPSKREIYFSESHRLSNMIKSFDLKKCLKTNAFYDNKYFIDIWYNDAVTVYKTDSKYAQSYLKSEKKGNF